MREVLHDGVLIVYLTREDWHAGSHRSGHAAPHQQFVGLVEHHTFMSWNPTGDLGNQVDQARQAMRAIQSSRPDLGGEVPYSFVLLRTNIAGVIIVAEGRGFGWTGAHTSGYNSTRYACSFHGNTSVDPFPLDEVNAAVRWVGSQLHDPVNAAPSFPHRAVKATECSGNQMAATIDQRQPPYDTEEDEVRSVFIASANKDNVGWEVKVGSPLIPVNGAPVDFTLDGTVVTSIGDPGTPTEGHVVMGKGTDRWHYNLAGFAVP